MDTGKQRRSSVSGILTATGPQSIKRARAGRVVERDVQTFAVMINSLETMPTKLLIVMMAGLALGAGACTGDDDPVPTTPTPTPVVDTFTGTLTRNGADTERLQRECVG